jgi:hypothetical protein
MRKNGLFCLFLLFCCLCGTQKIFSDENLDEKYRQNHSNLNIVRIEIINELKFTLSLIDSIIELTINYHRGSVDASFVINRDRDYADVIFTYYFDAIYNIWPPYGLNPTPFYSDNESFTFIYDESIQKYDIHVVNLIGHLCDHVYYDTGVLEGLERIELLYKINGINRILIIDSEDDIETVRRFMRMITEAGGLK